jgi:hypothetical protein
VSYLPLLESFISTACERKGELIDSTFTPQLVPSQPITTDDLERDAVFSQRVRLFGWIREKHLDVPEGEASQGFLGFAQQGQLFSPDLLRCVADE